MSFKCISGQAGLLEDHARIAVRQNDELFEHNYVTDVAEVGIGQTGHFIFQQKRKVNLLQRAQPFNGKHKSSCPGNTPAEG